MAWKSKTDSYPEIRQTILDKITRDPFTVLGNIGNTPLIQIRNIINQAGGASVYAKAEWFNPGGSVKDRAALNMIREGERTGELTKDKIIIDATSGNTGIAFAMIGSTLGYKVKLALPSNASIERKQILHAYGAEVIETDPLSGTDGAQQCVKEIVAANPGKYYYPDQYNNPANWRAHYNTTALEIWNQTEGRLTHFVAGLGTSGTFIGTSRKLKELNPSIVCVSFEPDAPLHGLEGLKHLPTSIVPGIYDSALADEHQSVSTDEAYDMARQLARREGLFVGISSGAAMVVARRISLRLREGFVVAVFPDGGSRYTSEHFWNE